VVSVAILGSYADPCAGAAVDVCGLLAGYSCYWAAVSDNFHYDNLLQCVRSIRGKGAQFVVEVDARDPTENASAKRTADDDVTTDLELADPTWSLLTGPNPDPTPSSALII
jgi:hypothetical protein